MVPDFPTLIKAALLVAGLVWIRAAWRNLPAEIEAYKTSTNRADRRAQLFVWALSAGVLVSVGWYLVGLLVTFLVGATL